VAGTVFGSGWPHLTLSVLWHATSGVARHLSDPRQGFPRGVRAGLPGASGFYVILLVLAALAGLLAATAIRVWECHRGASTRSKDRGRSRSPAPLMTPAS